MTDHDHTTDLPNDQLRDHLADDHGVVTFADDSESDLLVMHDGVHRIVRHDPPAEEVPAEVRQARAEVELYRLKQAELAYDVAMPTTLRERMAYARSLASSGLIPKAFRSGRGGEDGQRETVANVLLAVELGNTLGLSPLQALCQINVVEGKPALGAEGQLAQVLQAGHDIYVDDERSDRTKATVVAQRAGQDRVHTIVYTLDDAVAAGLCRIVDGKPHARSSQGKPLPWETSTPDMLVWRAVTRTCKRVFPDVTGGLAATEDEPGTQYAGPQSDIGRALTNPPAKATRTAAEADSVEDDLALFTDETGPWWTHAGATVRRRNKLQLAADRLAVAAEQGDDRVPEPQADDVVDAELVDDPVPSHAGMLADDSLGDPAVIVDVAAEADALAAELADAEPVAVDEPLDAAADELPADAEEPAQPLDRNALWAEVEALAQTRGKSVPQLLARHVLATRVNPEDMDAAQLAAFLNAQRGL